MSTRRSGRAKAPVKYTSDSENSDFGTKKKPRKTAAKVIPKKRTKAETRDDDDDDDASPAAAVVDRASSPKKRTKKSPAPPAPAREPVAKAPSKASIDKAHKAAWEKWLASQDAATDLLTEEPARESSITQTDALKKYGLKKEELGSLAHFEKRNPLYNNTMKVFVEDEVKVLGWRKAGILSGAEGDDDAVIKKGEAIWTNDHKDDPKEEEAKPDKKKEKAPKEKTPKQKWTAYLESHTSPTPDAFKEEPENAINQSDCKPQYKLLPADLAVLSYFPKPNQKYGNTTKLFKESEVKELAYRKAAVLGGVDEADEEVLEKGKALFEEE